MLPDEKLKIERPTKAELNHLRKIVDDIENSSHQGIDVSEKLNYLNSQRPET